MRFGGPVLEPYDSPEQWIERLQRRGYRAAYCPVGDDAGEERIAAYADAARCAEIRIAEVGAWSNLLHPDPQAREKALQLNVRRLRLADAIGAACCVNTPGSFGQGMCDPHPKNLSSEAFDLVVANARRIIDEAKPTRAVYAIEPMPFMFPDTPQSYLDLIEAIDRPGQLGVHLDVVNWISSPQKYYRNASFIREVFAALGPRIVSVHVKDTLLRDGLMCHIDEVAPGEGTLDYQAFFKEMQGLDPDIPALMEHLKTEEAYLQAAIYLREQARQAGMEL